VLEALQRRGALFFRELASECRLDAATLTGSLGELVAAGLVISDGFAGVRALLRPSAGRPASRDQHARSAGRWSVAGPGAPAVSRESVLEAQAWSLLRRYGVIFRRLLARESNAAPWRDLARVYRRLEARGEIRGGRFVSGMSGEQFALPEAVETLREIRRTPRTGQLLAVGAADPLNLTGILNDGDRVRATTSNRVVYQDGIAIAALEGNALRLLAPLAEELAAKVATIAAERPALSQIVNFGL
jgi:ATP-dependent Lhr-like helicase